MKIIKIFKATDEKGRQVLHAELANKEVGLIRSEGVMLGEKTFVCGHKCDPNSARAAYHAYANKK